MKFLRSKIVLILIVLMSIACMISASIAVRTSITVIEKKDQAVKPAAQQNTQHGGMKRIDAKDMAELPLYFNGIKVEGIEAYLLDRKYYFLAIDEILKKIGAKYNYFDSDDILQTSITGKKMILNLGNGKLMFGSNDIVLSKLPLVANNHILVPIDMLSNLDGFKTEGYLEKKVVFLNYFPGYMDKINERIKLLRFTSGIANISDISSKDFVSDGKDSFVKEGILEASNDKTVYLLKSGDKIYMISAVNGSFSVRNINADSSATLSEDGKYAYWVDYNKKTSFIYELGSGRTSEFGDYYFRIKNNGKDRYLPGMGTVISDYKNGGSYKRVSLTDIAHTSVYTFIERKGKTVIEGNTVCSPDKKKLLYYNGGKCYLLNIDGTELTLLGETEDNEFRWISNSKIFMLSHSDNKMYIIGKKGKTKTSVDVEWKKVGQTQNGDTFYTKGNSLFKESEGIERKIADLPWTITTFEDSISSPADGSRVALLQRENGFITICNINTKEGLRKKVVLNYPAEDQSSLDAVKSMWITNDRFIIYTAGRGWVIDFKDETRIFEWDEPKGSAVKEVLLRP